VGLLLILPGQTTVASYVSMQNGGELSFHQAILTYGIWGA
jgi:hypothetical protein